MYTEHRVRWWLERSASPEYQEAYDLIASQLGEGRVLVDVACGPGELLKRAADSYDLVVGQDASEAMLHAARGRLGAAGIDATIVDPASLTRDSHGVVLVQDDLLSSSLPDDLADTTTFTFPNLGNTYKKSPFDSKLLKRWVRIYGQLPRSQRNDMVVTLRADHHMARITRPDGKLFRVIYDVSGGPQSENDRSMEVFFYHEASFHGCEHSRSTFVGNPAIWNDAQEKRVDQRHMKQGYRISLSIKSVTR